jgi:putative membrane protein
MKDHLGNLARGIAIGAADVVPGVSGGTIALITGIYDRLINAISNVVPGLKKLLKGEIKAFWETIDGSFLLSIFIGIAISFISLAKGISYALVHYPEELNAFFFGLILSSAIYLAKQIPVRTTLHFLIFALGVGVAYGLTILPPLSPTPSYAMVFGAGAIAICAMILPGISGSFILLIMGMYEFILGGIKDFKLAIIGTFMAGAVLGILSFAKLLSWLFKHYKSETLWLLTGFLIGALNKVWPWKVADKTLEVDGKVKVLTENNLAPQQDSLFICLALFAVGVALVFILEKVGNATKK